MSDQKANTDTGTETGAPHSVEERARTVSGFFLQIPYNRALGIALVDLEENVAIMSLPNTSQAVGDPGTGVQHGGAITSLMDTCCGAAVFMAMADPKSIATLDLRIDYLRLGTADQPMYCRAECYRMTSNVAFVRATAYHPVCSHTLIASAVGSFMLGTKSRMRPDKTDDRKGDA